MADPLDRRPPRRCPPGPAGWAAAHRYYDCWLHAARWLAEGRENWRRIYPLHRFCLPPTRHALTRLLAAEGWRHQERRALVLSLRAAALRNRDAPRPIPPEIARKIDHAVLQLRVPHARFDPDAGRGMPLSRRS